MRFAYRQLFILGLLLASPLAARSAAVPRFETATCPNVQGVAWLDRATCGYLVVPENRSKPGSRTIRLLVAKDPARSPHKRPDSILYLEPTLQSVPQRIGGLAAGNPTSIEAIAKDRASRAPPYTPTAPVLGDGLAFGVTCREDYPFATPDELAAAGRAAFPAFPPSVQREGIGGWAYVNEDCGRIWKVPAAPNTMHAPVASIIPALLFSGTFDTLTSLAGAKDAATRLSHATIVIIRVGHTVSPWSPCAQSIIVAFYDAPERAPDTSCAAALKAPAFTSKS